MGGFLDGGGQESAANWEAADAPPEATGLSGLLAAAQAGDTVSAPGGTYRGNFTVPVGVTLRPEQGARVVIDVLDSFDLRGATVRDIEIMSSNTDRTAIQTGVDMSAPQSHLIGCYVHDIHSNGVNWLSSGAGEIIDCLFINNGFRDAEGTPRAHCIYSHNHGGGARLIENNILLGGMGAYALHIYSAGNNALRDYTVRSNVTTFRPTIVGGGLGVSNLRYEGNIQHTDVCLIGRYSQNTDCIVTGNRWSGGATLEISGFQSVIESDNAAVTEQDIVITPCLHSARQIAHVTVLNPAGHPAIDIDLTGLGLTVGVHYVLRNAQDYAKGYAFAYDGAALSLPLTGWQVQRAIGGIGQRASTLPAFGVFILERL